MVVKMNTWPGGKRRALTQLQHESWNENNYPGTLQLCCKCEEPTGRCEEDQIVDDDGSTYCYSCYVENNATEL
jgi:hypothetical protein